MRKIKFLIITCVIILSFVFMNDATAKTKVEKADDTIFKSEYQLKKEMDKSLKKEKNNSTGIEDVKAGKGEFYKAYEEEIEIWKKEREKHLGKGSADVDVALLKKFDYVRGEFDCSWNDVSCHITNFVYGTSSTVINWTMIPFSEVVIKPSSVLNNGILNDYKSAFNKLTRSLLALFFLFQIVKLVTMRMADIQSATNETNEKVILFIVSAFLLFSYNGLFTAIMNIQYVINYPLLSGLSATDEIGKIIAFNMLFLGSINMTTLFLAIVAVLIVVLILQMYYSLALISLMYVTGPVAITTMINSEYNFYSVWLRILISRLLTLGLQALCVVLGIRFFASVSFDPVTTLVMSITAISFFVVAITIPALLGQYGNSTGSGRAIMGAGKAVTRYMILRR